MKKIMFSRKYGLEQAVIAKTKDKTRREAHLPDGLTHSDLWHPTMGIDDKGKVYFTFDCIDGKQRDLYPQYQVGEVLAVAQSYKVCGYATDTLQRTWVKEPTIFPDLDPVSSHCGWVDLPLKYHKGWDNKMFVMADLMPHAIRITDISIERLQDISDEDCMREGVEKWLDCFIVTGMMENGGKNNKTFNTPRAAFASLIDRISGKGTWERNPWTWAYEFELIR